VGRIVSILKGMAEQERKGRRRKEEEKEKARFVSYVQKMVAEVDLDLQETVKELGPQVLTRDELERVKQACRSEIDSSPAAVKMREVVSSFVELCELLAKPENHIKVRAAATGPAPNEAEMVNEMARVLTQIPRYTAYAKVFEEKGGESIVWKGTIRREKLPNAPAGAFEEAMKVVVENASSYTRPRGEIEDEIRKRQADWRQVSHSRPQAQTQKAARPAGKPVEPPPTRTSTRMPTDR
jgi:hypothetical protein